MLIVTHCRTLAQPAFRFIIEKGWKQFRFCCCHFLDINRNINTHSKINVGYEYQALFYLWSKGEIERLQQPHGNSLPLRQPANFRRFRSIVLVCYVSAAYPLNNLWEVDVCKIYCGLLWPHIKNIVTAAQRETKVVD